MILSIMLLLTNYEVHVFTTIRNLTDDYEPWVRIGTGRVKEDFLSALIDIWQSSFGPEQLQR